MATVTATIAARRKPPKRHMTAEQFYDWVHRPENYDRFFELERGEVIEMPPPGGVHGVVCGNLGGILRDFGFKRQKGVVCTNDTGVIVERDPDTVRGIDVTFYDLVLRYEEVPRKYLIRPPTVAVEVLSPDDRPGKLARRITQFLHRGVKLVWIIDPDVRNVTVYQVGKEPYVVEDREELTGNKVLPDFRCRVSEFFEMPGGSVPARKSPRRRK
jgi:Uma2 family endonuclease